MNGRMHNARIIRFDWCGRFEHMLLHNTFIVFEIWIRVDKSYFRCFSGAWILKLKIKINNE